MTADRLPFRADLGEKIQFSGWYSGWDLRATLVARMEWDLASFRILLPISL